MYNGKCKMDNMKIMNTRILLLIIMLSGMVNAPLSIIHYTFDILHVSLSIAKAQQIGTWQVYPSYWKATQNLAVGNKVYSLMDGNLLLYDTEDTSVKTYNCLDDLSDRHIAQMAYSQETKRLILVYDNGNIDLMDLEDNIVNISSLKESSMKEKTVNNIAVEGSMAYLCTGFGLVEVDMAQAVIRETYRLGMNVQAMCVKDDRLFVGTSSGLYRSTEGNAHLVENWQKVSTSSNKYHQMVTFDGSIFVYFGSGVYQLNEMTGQLQPIIESGVRYLRNCDGKMLFGGPAEISVYTTANNRQRIAYENDWQDLSCSGSLFWASEGMEGLKGYKLDGDTFVETVGKIQPNSPVRDLSYRLQYVGDRLLVAGGINTPYAIYNPATAMYYENGEWTNFDEETPAEQYPKLHHWNTTNLVQDPNDDTHHFASPYRTGLYEYRNGKFVKLYNSENSPLQQIGGYGLNYVGCTGVQYDSEGNLWMMNQQTDTIVRVLQPSGKWVALYYNEIEYIETPDDYLFTTSGVNFLVSRRMDGRGFFGFHTNGTLANVKDDRHLLRGVILNQDGTSYSPDEFYCMTEDMDGRIWCGTELGLFVINDATTFFDDDFTFEQVKISREDGSGLADYLLSGVSISCIAIDGGNRKWIGTHSNGLYLVSADGQEMLQHFQTTNSPILSDHIQSVAVHPVTGMVMIGTDVGLCSYVGDATEAETELDADNVVAYPNPVSPDYRGPIAVRGLTQDCEVKICSSTGQLVWSGTSVGGTFTWNGTDKRGRHVSSGVYQVVANTSDGKKAVVCRIIVIR